MFCSEDSFSRTPKKLGGTVNGYRVRVSRWRMVFALKNGDIDIADIFPKKGRGDYRHRP